MYTYYMAEVTSRSASETFVPCESREEIERNKLTSDEWRSLIPETISTAAELESVLQYEKTSELVYIDKTTVTTTSGKRYKDAILKTWEQRVRPLWKPEYGEFIPLMFDPNRKQFFIPQCSDFPPEFNDILKQIGNSFYSVIKEYEETDEYKIFTMFKLWDSYHALAEFRHMELSLSGNRLHINNLDELKRCDSAYLQRVLDEIEIEIKFFNKEPFPPSLEDYDIIIAIFTHGAVLSQSNAASQGAACLDDAGGTCPILIPEETAGMPVKFLVAARSGVVNAQNDKEMYDILNKEVRTSLMRGQFSVENLQHFLRMKKKSKIDSIGRKELKTKLKKFGDSYLDYIHDTGWYVADKYVERRYVLDESLSISVLFSKPGTPLTASDDSTIFQTIAREVRHLRDAKLFRGHIYITRTELLRYLASKGYKFPLIIDTSCGSMFSKRNYTPRDTRHIGRTATNLQVAGKKNKTKKNKIS